MGIDRPFGKAPTLNKDDLITEASHLVRIMTEHPSATHEELFLCHKLKLNERRMHCIKAIIEHLRKLCSLLKIGTIDEEIKKERVDVRLSLSRILSRGVAQ